MAPSGNLICINQLMNRVFRPNNISSSCQLSTLYPKGTPGTCLHGGQTKKKTLLLLVRPNIRNLSSFNLKVTIGQQQQGHLIPSMYQQQKISTLLDKHVIKNPSCCMTILPGCTRFMSSSSSEKNKRSSSTSSRYKLSDLVDTKYGMPATMKEVTLIEKMIDSVIYEDQNIIAFNKPLGTHVFGQTIPGQEDHLGYGVVINPDLPPQPYACIADIMPMLRQHFQSPNLKIVHSIKMFYTGVLIMAKSNQVKDAVIQAIDRSKSPGSPYQTYLAVTYGIPQIEGIKESTFYLTQKKHQGEIMSFPCETASKTQRKRSQIQKVNIRCNVLKSNYTLNCALVRFDTSKDKCHSTELFATQELCCILGDYLYSSRVARISDIPMKVEPHAAEVGKQKLPPLLRKILRTKFHEQMPLHLHRAKVDLRNFQKKSTLSILAPYPNYFAATLKKLDLHFPFEDIFKDDSQNG